MDYADYPRPAVEDIARLRRRLKGSTLPDKVTDFNLLIGTWNIRSFGRVYGGWEENSGSPKRNLRALAYIAEIVRRLDVVAIQEVKRDTAGIRMLLEEFLGPHWGLIMSDVTAGAEGNVERLEELKALAEYVAVEIRNRARTGGAEESNLIVLGDFNIDERRGNPLFQAFVSTGLTVPLQLFGLKTTYNSTPEYYDQIAWFMGDVELPFNDHAGVIDFAGAVYKDLTLRQMSYRVSDHFPLWVEFIVDRSAEHMARTLGLDPATPNPLSAVPA